jgi:GDPmannose 4,6-dehydratase
MNQSNTNRRIRWERTRVDDIGYIGQRKCIVSVAPHYLRPTEVKALPGVPSKAEGKLGWTTTTKFAEVVREGLKVVECDELIKRRGFQAMDCRE